MFHMIGDTGSLSIFMNGLIWYRLGKKMNLAMLYRLYGMERGFVGTLDLETRWIVAKWILNSIRLCW